MHHVKTLTELQTELKAGTKRHPLVRACEKLLAQDAGAKTTGRGKATNKKGKP
ncbi:MAG: hypothetical protein WC364_13250 [Eubacteriales bacterium]|jgi:hypothetical protein